MNEGLYHGVPLLVFPQMLEQLFVARRVAAIGAGKILGDGDLRPEKLRQMTLAVSANEQMRTTARAIGESFKAAGGYKRAAREIMNFFRGGQS